MQKIHFKNEGQYLLWIVIDDEGVVVDSNRHESICKKFRFEAICLDSLKENENILIQLIDKNNKIMESSFEVEKIEPIDE